MQGGVKTWKPSVVGYGYFLELPISYHVIVCCKRPITSCMNTGLFKVNSIIYFKIIILLKNCNKDFIY